MECRQKQDWIFYVILNVGTINNIARSINMYSKNAFNLLSE